MVESTSEPPAVAGGPVPLSKKMARPLPQAVLTRVRLEPGSQCRKEFETTNAQE